MKRILVVEDEQAIAFGLRLDLQNEGYAVDVEADGVTALERAMKETFDLILLDVMLPRKDGFDICRDLRRAGCRTPIMMLTARDAGSGDRHGARAWRRRLRDQAVQPARAPGSREGRASPGRRGRRSGSTPSEIWRWTSGAAKCGAAGKPVGLTALEFKLLAAFVRNRGRLLNRSHLLDLVWGPGTFRHRPRGGQPVVSLRKKIEPDPSQPRYLLNVRGLGYRFDA